MRKKRKRKGNFFASLALFAAEFIKVDLIVVYKVQATNKSRWLWFCGLIKSY